MRSTRILARIAWLSAACVGAAQAGINSWTMTGPEGGAVHAVAYHPTQSGLAVISTPRGLYRTTDDGGSWALVHRTSRTAGQIAFDPSNPDRVFVADGQLWRSDDGGQTFLASPQPMADNALFVGISAGGNLYTGNQNGSVWRSADHGATWTTCGRPFPTQARSSTFAVDPNSHAGDRLYLAIERNAQSAGIEGTWRSVDGCANWIAPGAGSPGLLQSESIQNYSVMSGDADRVLAASNMGVYLSEDAGLTWARTYFQNSWHVEFDQTTPGRAYSMGMYGRFIVSNSGGSSWSWSGITNTAQFMSFTASPVVPGRVMAATMHGPLLSNDAAATFTRRVSGLRAGYPGALTTAHDGSIYTVLYAGAETAFRRDPASGAWLPLGNAGLDITTLQQPVVILGRAAVAPSDPSLIYVAASDRLVMRSIDGGNTWTGPNADLRAAGADGGKVTVDPGDPQVAYIASASAGFWKTVDRGTTWTRLTTTLPQYLTAFTIDPNNANVLYVAGNTATSTDDSRVYKSPDGGVTWIALGATPPLPNTGDSTKTITVDPHNTLVMYAGQGNRIYKSLDGGLSWTMLTWPQSSDSLGSGRSIAVDPVHQGTITISSRRNALLRSVNGGVNWEEIPLALTPDGGLSVLDMVLDPVRPGRMITSLYYASIGEYEVAPDLSVTMANMSNSMPVGSNTQVRFTVRNRGPHASSPADLRIDIPPNTGASWPAGCSLGMQVVYCDVPALQVDAEHVISLLLHPLSPTSGNIAANLTTHETDPDSSNNSTSFAVTAGEITDIDLTLTATPSTLDRGATTRLTAVVVNHGPSVATNARLNLSGLPNFAVTAIQTDTGACSAGATPTCSFGTLAADAVATVQLDLRADTFGDFAIIGAATSTSPDADGQQSTAYLPIHVTRVADVSVSITESADPVVLDWPLRYTVNVQNLSGDPGPAQLVVSIGGAPILSAIPNTGTCASTATTVTCDFVPTPGAALTLDLGTATAGIVTATATVTYGGTDSNPGNNTQTVGTTVRRTSDLQVTVAPGVTSAALDAEFTFTAAVHNDGPNAAPVSLNFNLAQAQVVSAAVTGGTCTNTAATADCTLASLGYATTATFTLRARGAAPGSAVAVATVTSSAFDTDSADNQATSAAVSLARVADLAVTMIESADPVLAGAAFSYTATISNLGPNAGPVQITVPVTGAAVTGATTSAGACTTTASQVTCDFPAFNSGSTATVRVDVNPATAGTAQAIATVAFSGTDPVTANNSVTVSTSVVAPPAPPAPSPSSGGSGGGGGGGRFDWLALFLLGGIAWRRGSVATAR